MRTVKRILILLCLLALVGCHRPSPSGLCVTVLDMGQSDCTLVRQGGVTLMIDAGVADAREAMRGALRAYDVDRVPILVLTHAHDDHYGNARMLIEEYGVETLILSPAESDDLGYRLVLQAAAQKGVRICYANAGERFAVGDATLEVLSVCIDAKDVNDQGLILRVTYGETAFLFLGDAEAEAEAHLLETVAPEQLRAQFVKVGHHGSDTSTSRELLQAVRPLHAAISCGVENDYGFPHAALLERLAAIGASVARTDLEGDLQYSSDGINVTRREKTSKEKGEWKI